MEKYNLEWFIQRIGRRIYPNKVICKNGEITCSLCKSAGKSGIKVLNEAAAEFLYNTQEKSGIKYFEKPVFVKYFQFKDLNK